MGQQKNILFVLTDQWPATHFSFLGSPVQTPNVDRLVSCDEDALKRANDTEAGLSLFVYTESLAAAEKATRELRVGEVMVNGFRWNIDLGGIKQSGMGHDCSHLALHDHPVVKRITVARS